MLFHLQARPQKENIKVSDVVTFEIKKLNFSTNQIQIYLETKENFKVYEHNLKFNYVPEHSLAYDLSYAAHPAATPYFDPFYKEKKKVFQNGTLFLFTPQMAMGQSDHLQIQVQSCSKSMCLLPAELSLDLKLGAVSQETSIPVMGPVPSSIKIVDGSSDFSAQKTVDSNAVATSNTLPVAKSLSEQIQDAILSKSFLLFPALFLAGLLMNLTPCVYPMIPITLSVMSHYGAAEDLSEEEKRKRKIIFPLIYVAGMVVTYSLLGVFAGMTGGLFGSQFSSPVFSMAMACVMFMLGLSMLGVFNLAAVQNAAHKIPLAKTNPILSVATMGAVSGLVSAPCTGPVLSMVLLLIAQNKDPISGFVFMLFFSCGFGLPYVALGFFSQKLTRLPRFPRLVFATKIFFASLMFALGLYFLNGILHSFSWFAFLFSKPNIFTLSVVFGILFLCLYFGASQTQKPIMQKSAHLGSVLAATLLALWLTFWTSDSFFQTKENPHSGSQIVWQTDFEHAIALAKKENKPLFVDVWAKWCAACLEMDQTVWRSLKIAQTLNGNYVALKLDYTDAPKDMQKLLDKWNIVGLPGVVVFPAGSDFEGKPQVQFQGKISEEKLLNSID